MLSRTKFCPTIEEGVTRYDALAHRIGSVGIPIKVVVVGPSGSSGSTAA
jgi:hypothetical protein